MDSSEPVKPTSPSAALQLRPHRGRRRIWIGLGVVGLLAWIGLFLLALMLAAQAGPLRALLDERLPPFANEQPGEMLVVIAALEHSPGIDPAGHEQLLRTALEEQAATLHDTGLRMRVERAPDTQRLRADDGLAAQQLASRYQASILIWGVADQRRVQLNVLRLRQLDFAAAPPPLRPHERAALAQPQAFTAFTSFDLPADLPFLASVVAAQALYLRADYSGAARLLDTALTRLPRAGREPVGVSEVYFQLGWLQQVQQHPTAAAAAYDQNLARHSTNLTALRNRGLAQAALGDLTGALADYDQALALAPRVARSLITLGLARFREGDISGAIETYTQALALDPTAALAYNYRAGAYLQRGELRQALDDYTRAVALDPSSGVFVFNRGLARYRLSDWAGAIADYDQALALHLVDAGVYYNRALAYHQLGDWPSARADYDRATQLDPAHARAYYGRGSMRANQGDTAGALADYNQALVLQPSLALAYHGRGTVRYDQGDMASAIADYTQVIRLDPQPV